MSFDTVKQLERAINRFMAEWNENAQPFRWVKVAPSNIFHGSRGRSRIVGVRPCCWLWTDQPSYIVDGPSLGMRWTWACKLSRFRKRISQWFANFSMLTSTPLYRFGNGALTSIESRLLDKKPRFAMLRTTANLKLVRSETLDNAQIDNAYSELMCFDF
jgi:hypothetical protein